MRHSQSVLMALMREPNEAVFQKTLALTEFYFGADDWEYPLGLIQMCAASHAERVFAVEDGQRLAQARVFHTVKPGFADWLRCD